MFANYIINDDVISVILNGRPYTIRESHPNYERVLDVLGEDLTEMEWKAMLDIPASVQHYFKGSGSGIDIVGNTITYNGVEINNTVCRRILEFMGAGLPYQPLINFLENLLLNPSKKAVDRLYDFLSHNGMAITPDGCFIGYKGVNTDYSSKYRDRRTGKCLYYNVGNVVKMDRNEVDDDENNACSHGIHVGTYEYASNWGPKVVLVKVNPADAVTVPLHEINKLRCCKLEVVGECEGLIDSPMYGSYENEVYEDGYDEDDEYSDYGADAY